MKRIAVVGYKGKMGGAVFNHLKTKGFAVVGVDKDDSLEDLSGVGLVIDFGGAESSAISAKWCEKNGVAIIIGSTGQTDEQNEIIESASKKVAVLKAGNFSIGIFFAILPFIILSLGLNSAISDNFLTFHSDFIPYRPQVPPNFFFQFV